MAAPGSPGMTPISRLHWPRWAIPGLIPTMVGNLFYLFGVATNGPARAAIFLYLSPLFSAGLAIGWLGEEIAWYHLAGVVAILTGLYLVGRSAPSGVQASPQHDRAEIR